MAQTLKSLVQDIFAHHDDYKIQLLKNWSDILGTLNAKVCLEKIEGDCLVLGVTDSCWMQELYMLSPLLLTTINEKLDSPRIKYLRFKKIGIRTNVARPTIKRSSYDFFVEKPLTRTESMALTHIKDPELKRALEKFLRRCQKEN
jgi:hypothetical protein